jgi:hypothetical protein
MMITPTTHEFQVASLMPYGKTTRITLRTYNIYSHTFITLSVLFYRSHDFFLQARQRLAFFPLSGIPQSPQIKSPHTLQVFACLID